MSEVKYEIKPVTEKRPKKQKRRSKYDPIIDDFLESEHNLVEITVKDKKASYIASQLQKRIRTRELDDIEASHRRGVSYLEKKKAE